MRYPTKWVPALVQALNRHFRRTRDPRWVTVRQGGLWARIWESEDRWLVVDPFELEEFACEVLP
jgi:hypothetical protein